MASTPRVDAQTEQWFAVLGRRDAPTDGIEDYCTFLGRALGARGVELRTVRLPWFEYGWIRALLELWRQSRTWTDEWVLLQYAAMAWSRRGFPFGAVAVGRILRRSGVRTAVVFHEPFRQGGQRWIDRCRGACQEWVIRSLYKTATIAIFADPLDTVPWLPAHDSKARFVAIGANIPEYPAKSVARPDRNGKRSTVVVFCLSDLPNRTREIHDVFFAMRFVHERGLKARLVFLGRGTDSAKREIEQVFKSSSVEVLNLGLQSASEVARVLSESDAMICVRGALYPRRGSAIAGIACGLPIVGYAGAAEGTSLEDAGIDLVPYGDRAMLAEALEKILGTDSIWKELHEKSLLAHKTHFSWDVIATNMKEALARQGGSQK